MANILLVIHLLLALGIVGSVLMQRSEGGGLGIGGGGGGGGGGGMGGLIGNRASANLLTRTTAVLAGLFFVTSIALAIVSGARPDGGSIVDQGSILDGGHAQPVEEPLEPEGPRVPLSE